MRNNNLLCIKTGGWKALTTCSLHVLPYLHIGRFHAFLRSDGSATKPRLIGTNRVDKLIRRGNKATSDEARRSRIVRDSNSACSRNLFPLNYERSRFRTTVHFSCANSVPRVHGGMVSLAVDSPARHSPLFLSAVRSRSRYPN